jgi:hypothetical protein
MSLLTSTAGLPGGRVLTFALPYEPGGPFDPLNQRLPLFPTEEEKNRGGGLPAPGGGGIVLLAILYLILLLSTVAAISALVAAPVLKFFGKLLDWDDAPSWGFAFTAAFFGFFAYFLVALLQTMAGGREMYDPVAPALTLPWIIHNVTVKTLPILACAAVIWWRMARHFRVFEGIGGFLRSVAVSVLCLWISTAMIDASARRVANAHESGQTTLEAMLGLSFLAVVFGVLGGLVSVVPLWIGMRIAAPRGAVKPGLIRSYFTAVMVLLTWLLGSLLLEFCFNMLDPVYFYFKDPAVAQQASLTAFEYLLPFALGFVCLQLAAVGFAGGVITKLLAPLFPGRAGWMRASMLALSGIAAAVLPCALLIAAMAASGQFQVLFQYF